MPAVTKYDQLKTVPLDGVLVLCPFCCEGVVRHVAIIVNPPEYIDREEACHFCDGNMQVDRAIVRAYDELLEYARTNHVAV